MKRKLIGLVEMVIKTEETKKGEKDSKSMKENAEKDTKEYYRDG